jgi:hypothetical protein
VTNTIDPDGGIVASNVGLIAATVFLLCILASPVLAQAETGAIVAQPAIGARKIFICSF